MSSLMKKIFKSSLITSIVLFILGLLLIIASETTIISISYIIGSVLVLLGVIGIINYVRKYNTEDKNELDFVYGIVTVILGLLIISNPKAIAAVIPFILGIGIVLSSAAKLNYAFQLKSSENDLWKSTLFISVLTTILGIVLIFNPFEGAVVITKLVGGIILAYSILDITSSLTIRKNVLKIHKAIEEVATNNTIAEAEVIDEKEGHAEEKENTEIVEKKEVKKQKKNKKKKGDK